MNIVIVDDDKEICSIVAAFLEDNNHKVNIFNSGDEALPFLKETHNCLDLIILDLHMPGICGIETCKQIRLFSQIPILILTSCNEDIQTILALEVGADDYMLKPFQARTLLARIKAILRRSDRQQIDCNQFKKYYFDNCMLDTRTHALSFKNITVPITTGVYKILKYFVENSNLVVSRDTLMDKIYNKSLESYDRSIDVQISRLRKILANCNLPNAIKTIHGIGYMWVIPVIRS